jgi:hypothetical protein
LLTLCERIAVANQVGKAWGQDIAEYKVATKVTPLGNVTYNVFHHNSGFGWCKLTCRRNYAA